MANAGMITVLLLELVAGYLEGYFVSEYERSEREQRIDATSRPLHHSLSCDRCRRPGCLEETGSTLERLLGAPTELLLHAVPRKYTNTNNKATRIYSQPILHATNIKLLAPKLKLIVTSTTYVY